MEQVPKKRRAIEKDGVHPLSVALRIAAQKQQMNQARHETRVYKRFELVQKEP